LRRSSRKLKIRTIAYGLGLLFFAGLIAWVPHQLKQPGPADHKILVATEALKDDGFKNTVILVLAQNGYGATGLILNHPAAVPGALPPGGPMEPNTQFTIHSMDLSSKQTVILAPDVGYTPGTTFPLIIKKMGDKPHLHKTFQGYTGWGRGQLTQEIEAHNWKVIDFNPAFVFHIAQEDLWNKAIQMPEVLPQ
jgi:putative transcriptional regulator